MSDFLLDYTASEINKKLGEIDNKLETVSWNDLTDKPFYNNTKVYVDYNLTQGDQTYFIRLCDYIPSEDIVGSNLKIDRINNLGNNYINELTIEQAYIVNSFYGYNCDLTDGISISLMFFSRFVTNEEWKKMLLIDIGKTEEDLSEEEILEIELFAQMFPRNPGVYIQNPSLSGVDYSKWHLTIIKNELQQMDAKFLPNIEVNFRINVTVDEGCESDKTYEEVLQAYKSGKRLYVMVNNEVEMGLFLFRDSEFTFFSSAELVFLSITPKSISIDNIPSLIKVDNELSSTSENPVQNKVIKNAIDEIYSKILADEPSYNDLKDKPFYYDEYTKIYNIGEQIVDMFPSDKEYAAMEDHYNENEYVRIFFDGQPYVFTYNSLWNYGNMSLLPKDYSTTIERTDTGEPFCVYCSFMEMSVIFIKIVSKENGYHVVSIEKVKKEDNIKQLDEKFIPDTIARTDNLTILPIERLADFGGSAEVDSSGCIDLCVRASMQNPTNYLFKTEINNSPKSLMFRFINSDGTKQLLNIFTKTYSSLLYHITNDTNNKCIIIYDIYFCKSYELFYDDDGNFVSRVSTSNVTSHNVLDELNSKMRSDSYSPTADTDVATKKYVDSLSQSFILNSSTEGSSKRFQITVDDAGTITAKEITS